MVEEHIINTGSEVTCTQVGHILREIICGKFMRKIDGCFVVSLRAFLSLHSGTHTELFVFTNVFGDVPATAGLRKLM